MAIVGILSTQLVHHHFIERRPAPEPLGSLTTLVDHVAAPIA